MNGSPAGYSSYMKTMNRILIMGFVAFTSISFTNKKALEYTHIYRLWLDCKLDNVISFEVFNAAILGYRQIENIKKKNIITIIDFSKPSTEKRFLVIDFALKHILYQCFVAHGKNSGENYARDFSNQSQSLKSCLGFFLTGETYFGKHGYSMRLNGLEAGINSNARNREIVIHGAEYVSQLFINKYGRIGRSWGCPALPLESSKEIIDKISDGSCLFIYSTDNNYKDNSNFL